MIGVQFVGVLNARKLVKSIEARGNSYLRSLEAGHSAEVHAIDMDFFFDDDQKLQHATATRDVRAQSLNADSQAEITGATSLEVDFQAQGQRSLLKEMRTTGRSVLTVGARQSRANDPKAASKRLTADAVKLVWRASGNDLETAEVAGNAELIVEPIQKTVKADRKTLTAPQFFCECYEGGNIAKKCTASDGGIKAVRDPLQPAQHRG